MNVIEIEDLTQLATELQEDFCVLKIWSERCGPCIKYTPMFKEIAQQYQGINFCSVNVSKKLFPPMPVPTTLIIVNGIIKNKIMGANKTAVFKAIDEILK